MKGPSLLEQFIRAAIAVSTPAREGEQQITSVFIPMQMQQNQMSASNTFETNILKLIYNNTTYAGMGDATGLVGSTAAGSLYLSLHTADPGEAGDQTTSETSYTSYARTAIARSTGGFTVSGNTVSNAAQVLAPACTGSTATLTHFGIGKASSGAGELYFSGALTPNLAVAIGIQPTFDIGQLTNTAD